jgi:hypothetical protein
METHQKTPPCSLADLSLLGWMRMATTIAFEELAAGNHTADAIRVAFETLSSFLKGFKKILLNLNSKKAFYFTAIE